MADLEQRPCGGTDRYELPASPNSTSNSSSGTLRRLAGERSGMPVTSRSYREAWGATTLLARCYFRITSRWFQHCDPALMLTR